MADENAKNPLTTAYRSVMLLCMSLLVAVLSYMGNKGLEGIEDIKKANALTSADIAVMKYQINQFDSRLQKIESQTK